MSEEFSFTGRVRSVGFALEGIATMLASQHNAWLHAAATVMVVSAGAALRIDRTEWCFLVLAMVAVWTAEALNTAFEFLADVASPGFHPVVKRSKDVAAGAVLITACRAVVIGAIVF